MGKKAKATGNWKCLLCGRNTFTRRTAHNCVGGYRKHNIKWEAINPAQKNPLCVKCGVQAVTEPGYKNCRRRLNPHNSDGKICNGELMNQKTI